MNDDTDWAALSGPEVIDARQVDAAPFTARIGPSTHGPEYSTARSPASLGRSGLVRLVRAERIKNTR